MPYRILVVDDEPDIREIVSILLQKMGMKPGWHKTAVKLSG